ncbi:MAG: hypothetical protein HUK26_02225 [Duodenibacillus sp.]|nr:hypothetical protein [Duodenibacillus sp.]
MKRFLFAAAACLALAAPGLTAAQTMIQGDPQALARRIGIAEAYLKEFEKEVARTQGGQKTAFRSQNEALSRVKELVESHPDDPRVRKLYDRAALAVKKSFGDFMEITPEHLAYKRNEEMMRKRFAGLTEKAWAARLEGLDVMRAFPAPDMDAVLPEQVKGRYVVLEDVRYPKNQFAGGTGEYVHAGKPSSGYYYVDIGTRRWLGPYEAIKRFRRQVDSSIGDDFRFTVLGRITGAVMESPDAGQDKKAPYAFGWTVQPEAVMLPGRVIGFYDAGSEQSGRFEGEEQVKAIKESWYTVRSIPGDVTPQRLMEIFAQSIKEKNYELYRACISPEWEQDVAYHWDLHQRRFAREYVAVVFDKGVVTQVKGAPGAGDVRDFFLGQDDKARLGKMLGEQVLHAVVKSRAYDENGRQLNPQEHRLVKKGSGRWYVDTYAVRF